MVMESIEKKLWDIEWGEQSVSIGLLLGHDKDIKFLEGIITVYDNLDNQLLASYSAFAKSLVTTNIAEIAYFVNRIAPHKVVETGYFMSVHQFTDDWSNSCKLLKKLSILHEACTQYNFNGLNNFNIPYMEYGMDIDILGEITLSDNKTGISVEIEGDTCKTVPQNNVTVAHTENCDITFNGIEHFNLVLKAVEDTKIII